MKTYQDLPDFSYSSDEYTYNPQLTKILERSRYEDVSQDIINEIVLWKINRYVLIDSELTGLLNSPLLQGDQLNEEFSKKVLTKLLLTKGVRLPMASTILRFRNPEVYQILDQRAYRFLLGKELNLSEVKTNQIKLNNQIDLYHDYLFSLKKACLETGWLFSEIDRILYLRDQEYNGTIKY